MKLHKLIISTLALALTLTGCEKTFDELEQDPNRPVEAPASLVFQGILNDMYTGSPLTSGVTGSPWGPEMRYNQFYASNYNYYATNEYNWTTTNVNYFSIKNVLKMEQEAVRLGAGAVNPYSALGKFFRAYFFENVTKRVGDIPLTDALKGIENPAAKYDTQKDVYRQILTWLDESNADLTGLIAKSDRTLAGDIYLGNDLRKWQKVVNTFKLRLLISLSKKEADADLAIKQKFAEVLANPAKFPVMESVSDNLQYTHNVNNKYPRNPSTFGFNATRENMAKTYIDALVERKDPRVFVVAEPAEAKLKAGLKATDHAAYVGASSGEDLADMSTNALKGEYSFQNRSRYYSNDVGESVFIIGYPELQFNIAEGISRGWAPGTAETHYKNGIMASMAFYGLTSAATLDAYYAQPNVKYAGNTAAGLTQILTQKYIAFSQNSGLEAFYNQRRTGIPTFLTGVGTANSARIPKRWQYPSNERVTNKTNLDAALAAQYGGKDDINEMMWLLK